MQFALLIYNDDFNVKTKTMPVIIFIKLKRIIKDIVKRLCLSIFAKHINKKIHPVNVPLC